MVVYIKPFSYIYIFKEREREERERLLLSEETDRTRAHWAGGLYIYSFYGFFHFRSDFWRFSIWKFLQNEY